jgi:hypothetical protein
MRPRLRTVMQSQIGTRLSRPLGQAIAQRIASVPGGLALLTPIARVTRAQNMIKKVWSMHAKERRISRRW